jgi:hypothetical protein
LRAQIRKEDYKKAKVAMSDQLVAAVKCLSKEIVQRGKEGKSITKGKPLSRDHFDKEMDKLKDSLTTGNMHGSDTTKMSYEAALTSTGQMTQMEKLGQQRDKNITVSRVKDKKDKILTEPPKSLAKVYKEAAKD